VERPRSGQPTLCARGRASVRFRPCPPCSAAVAGPGMHLSVSRSSWSATVCGRRVCRIMTAAARLPAPLAGRHGLSKAVAPATGRHAVLARMAMPHRACFSVRPHSLTLSVLPDLNPRDAAAFADACVVLYGAE
jgi:hypothetical protein